MMQLNEEQLEGITRMAAAAYTPRQIANAMGFDGDEFTTCLQLDGSPANVAFYKGFYSAELAVRESVFLLARTGSSPAQTLAIKLLDETRKTLKKDGIAAEETI